MAWFSSLLLRDSMHLNEFPGSWKYDSSPHSVDIDDAEQIDKFPELEKLECLCHAFLWSINGLTKRSCLSDFRKPGGICVSGAANFFASQLVISGSLKLPNYFHFYPPACQTTRILGICEKLNTVVPRNGADFSKHFAFDCTTVHTAVHGNGTLLVHCGTLTTSVHADYKGKNGDAPFSGPWLAAGHGLSLRYVTASAPRFLVTIDTSWIWIKMIHES